MLTHLMVLKKYTYLLSSTISGNLVDNIRRAIINNVNRETHLTNSAIDLLYQSCMHRAQRLFKSLKHIGCFLTLEIVAGFFAVSSVGHADGQGRSDLPSSYGLANKLA